MEIIRQHHKDLLLLVFFCLLAYSSFAQSDDCATAPELLVFDDCFQTSGNTQTLDGISLGNACGGNTDDDGWFRFKAISSRTRISVSTTQLLDMGIGVFKDCEQEIECIDSRALGGQEILEFETELEIVYYIQVFEVNEGGGEFLICVSDVADNTQSDCAGAVVICENNRIEFNPRGSGLDDFEPEKNEFGCLKDRENQSAWYYFEIQEQAPPNLNLTFNLSPETSPDYDFALFGPDVLCEELGYPIRCSWADAFCEACPKTGLGNGAKDVMEGADGDGFVAPLLVQPGEGYFLLIDNYWQTATGFILEWGGEAAPFLNCEAQPPCGLLANAGLDQFYCAETQFSLNGSVKNTFENPLINWTSVNGANQFLTDSTILNPTIQLPSNFSSSLNYILTVTGNNCSDQDSVVLFSNCDLEIDCTHPITADFTITPPNCINATSGNIQIGLIEGGTPPYSYQINVGNFQTMPNFINLSEGSHLIYIRDALGCQTDTIIEIPMADLPSVTLGEDLTLNQGKIIDLQLISKMLPKQIESVAWSGINTDNCNLPCLNPQFMATNSTLIQATLTTISGCTNSDELQIIVEPKIEVYIPTAFSPNGDGINDVFIIHTGSGISNIASLMIVDRWANVVFEANNFPPNRTDFSWDGKVNNQVLNNAVFAYFVVLDLPNGDTELRSGEIVVVK